MVRDAAKGKWMLRNQRWHFVPPGTDLLDRSPGELSPWALLGPLDPKSLEVCVGGFVNLSGLPVTICLSRHSGSERPEDLREPLVYEFFPRSDSENRNPLRILCGDSVREAALNCFLQRVAVLSDTVLGAKTVTAHPLVLSDCGRRTVVGSAAILTASRDRIEVAPENQDRVGPWVEVLGRILPTEEAVRESVALLDGSLHRYLTQVEELFGVKLELAAEQATSRGWCARAEAMRKQLLGAPMETSRAVDGSGLETLALEALMGLPQVGVVIEDTDYVIRYVSPMVRKAFGYVEGRKCYQALKGQDAPCEPCPLVELWQKGRESMRYTTQDSRTGRTFEVVSIPQVSSSGEKLIIELGIEVTETNAWIGQLESEVARLKARSRQLALMERELVECYVDMVQETADPLMEALSVRAPTEDSLLPPLPAGGSRHERLEGLLERQFLVNREASTIAVALTASGGLELVDVEELVRRAERELLFEHPELRLEIRVAVMPQVETDLVTLSKLLTTLVELQIRNSVSPVVRVSISHTMSGQADAVVLGDDYHVFWVGDSDRRPVFTSGSPSEITQTVDVSTTGDYTENRILSLLSKRLGGGFWQERTDDGRLAHCFSLPHTPPSDLALPRC